MPVGSNNGQRNKFDDNKPRKMMIGNSRTCPIHVEQSDQNRLNSFFRQELACYNNLVNIFASRVRAFPESIKSITAEQGALFCELAALNLNIRDFIKSPDSWPKELEKFRSVVWNSNNEMILNSAQILMMESAGREKFTMIPETKRAMARAVLDHFKRQAEIFADPQTSDKTEVAYKFPPQNLGEYDISVKRHAQVPRSAVKMKYVPEHNYTEMYTPLNVLPIIIPEVNMNEYNGWGTVILKQANGRWVDNNTPWMAEFKNTKGEYILRYIDVGGGGAGSSKKQRAA